MLRVCASVLLIIMAGCSVLCGQSGPSTLPADPAREPQLKAVEGTVVNSVTGEPIRRALVSLSGISQRFAFSDSDGRFSFENVPAVRVMLQATRPGYFAPHDRPTFVDLAKASVALKLELIPSAVISGRVLGADDQPLERAPVEIFESFINEGRRRWMSHGMKMTDEDGTFRMPGLKPGVYKIAAGPLRNRDLQGAGLGYATTYYPHSPDRNSAGLVRLAPAQTSEINFKLRPVRFYRVSGVVVGETGRGAGISVYDSSNVPVQMPVRVDFTSSAFELTLPAGTYTIRAVATDGRGRFLRAKTSIAIASDISGLTLALRQGLTIPVVVHRQFTNPPQTQSFEPPSTTIRRTNVVGASLRLFSVAQGELSAGGYSLPTESPDTAVISNIDPGTYEVEAMPQGAWSGNLYIASVQCGTRDLFREPLTIADGGDVDAIEVVIKDDGALLEGTVHGATDGGQVMIVSETQAKRRIIGNYSPEGRLYAPVLPPGDYTLYAFDHAEQIEYSNPEVLERYRSKAVHISVAANQTAQVTLDLIETQP